MSLIQSNFQVVRNALTLAGYAALLIRFSPWMALAVLAATVPAFLAEARFSGAAFRLRNWRSPDSRRLTYLEYVLANDEHAKEVKLFGLGPLLLERYRRLAESFFADDRRLAIGRAGWGYALSLLSTAVFYGSYALIVAETVRGRLSLGDMTLALVAFRQGQQSFQAVLSALGGMYEDTLYMSNLFDYFAIPTDAPQGDGAAGGGARGGGDSLRGGRLSLSGPAPAQWAGRRRWALRDVNLFIPKGQSLALVGENGAGKTTFIKLLANLYQPTEGQRAARRARPARPGTRRSCAAASASSSRTSTSTSWRCARTSPSAASSTSATSCASGARSSGAARRELAAGLSAGLETQLGRWFSGGVELSGGQWQKVALARAFMRDEADILILDEPTAALDAEAEHAVFQRFRALAAGRTTILISHRFPTVRMADRILVLEAGAWSKTARTPRWSPPAAVTRGCSSCRRPAICSARLFHFNEREAHGGSAGEHRTGGNPRINSTTYISGDVGK